MPSTASIALLVAAFILTLAGVAESALLARSRHRIPLRIHVNGTRGKSSVVRLIAAALREGGFITVAKTTGTLPRLIHTDGTESPIVRRSKANIIEQARTIRLADAEGARALVFECMALQPLLQSISELKIVRSTHTVITNARPDHLDVMGPTARDATRAMCGMVCIQGKVFTAEEENLDVIDDAARDRGSSLVAVNKRDVASVTAADLAPFSYTEHAENVALALSICAELGVDRQTALRGMYKASPDPGAMTIHALQFFGREIFFYNAFAANDPVSTERLWDLALRQHGSGRTKIAVFNCRADRVDRTVQLAEALTQWQTPDYVVLMGEGTQLFARVAARRIAPDRFVAVEGLRVEEIFERLVELSGGRAVIMGMGNIGGQGLDVARYFRNREVRQSTEQPL